MIKAGAAIRPRELMHAVILGCGACIGEPQPGWLSDRNTRATALAKAGPLRDDEGQSATVSHFGSNQQSASPS